MKRVLCITNLVIIILMIGGLSAHAALVQSEVYDATDNWTNPNNPSDTGTKIKPSNASYPELGFDLTLQDPYTPGTKLTSAQLVLNLADDSSYSSTAGASVTITLASGDSFESFIVEGPRQEYLIDINDQAVLDELATGTLSFNLGVTADGDEKNNPDYIFYDAQMKAEAVPIAPAIVLLGSGLVGLAGVRRRRSRK